jgi:hypothetical protein
MPRFGLVAGLLLFLTVATYFISSGTPSPHHHTRWPRVQPLGRLSISSPLVRRSHSLIDAVLAGEGVVDFGYPDRCFFSVGKSAKGAWWFIDPKGARFFSNGVDVVNYGGDSSTTGTSGLNLTHTPNATWSRTEHSPRTSSPSHLRT